MELFKRGFAFGLILILVLISLVAENVKADTIQTGSLSDQLDKTNDILGDLPTDPQATQEMIRDRYLKEEWNKIISNNTYIGPTHNFFMSNQWFFKIVFNEDYSFSLTFIFTTILWIVILFLAYKVSKAYLSSLKSLLAGILVAIVFAHATIINWVVNSVFHLVYAKETWWMRLILWIIFALVIFLIYFVEVTLLNNLRSQKEKKDKQMMQQKIADNEAFIKGVKEGQKTADDVSKGLT